MRRSSLYANILCRSDSHQHLGILSYLLESCCESGCEAGMECQSYRAGMVGGIVVVVVVHRSCSCSLSCSRSRRRRSSSSSASPVLPGTLSVISLSY